jgi:hypothetical protein
MRMRASSAEEPALAMWMLVFPVVTLSPALAPRAVFLDARGVAEEGAVPRGGVAAARGVELQGLDSDGGVSGAREVV